MSIFGHSVGDHETLICAPKNPGKYKSVSAFAPICNLVLCLWDEKSFSRYLGTDQNKWKTYDATQLVRSYPGAQLDIIIDEGKDNQFLPDGQSLLGNFTAACTEKKVPVVFRFKRVMMIATASLQPSFLITSEIMQNTRMHEKLKRISSGLQKKNVINRIAGKRDFKLLDFIVLQIHHP